MSPGLAGDHGREDGLEARARIVDGARGFERSETRPLPRAIFHGSGVERENFGVGAFFDALVKAAAGFFAEPAAADHLFDERGNAVEFARFVIGRIVVDIANDVGEDVEADDIGGAEGGGLGPADGGARAGVHFLDAHAEAGHERKRSEHGKSADAIGDEIWSILGADHSFAQAAIAEIAERVEDFGGSGRAGNEFDELHVTRGIEEMRAGPMALEIVVEAFGDLADG